MKQLLLIIAALITITVAAQAQYDSNQVRKVNSLPATCTTGTTNAVVYAGVIYHCTATNTWTKSNPGSVITSTYAGLGTCAAGNDGQIKRVTDTNQDLYSCNGAAGVWVSRNGNVYNVADFSGASLTAKITAALAAMPSTGGTLDLRAYEGAQSLNSITISKSVSVLLGGTVFTLASGQTITVSAVNVHFIGNDRAKTEFKASSATPVFTISGTFGTNPSFEFANIWFDGNSVASSQAIYIPDNSLGVQSLTGAKNMIRSCHFKNFGTYAIYIGQSTYWNTVTDNVFLNDNGCIYVGADSDTVIFNNVITSSGANPGLFLVGTYCQVISNELGVDQTGTWGTPGEDIRITTVSTSSTSGLFNINNNRFNSENDFAARYKIKVMSNAATDVIPAVNIGHNWFGGYGSTQKAIYLGAYIDSWTVSYNTFTKFTTLVDEQQDMTVNPGGGHGGSVWSYNRFPGPQDGSISSTTIFTRGGVDFSVITNERNGGFDESTSRINAVEATEVRNRLPNNTDLTNATYWTVNGVAVAGSVSDPYGGTSAATLTSTGSNNSESVYATPSMTGLKDSTNVASSGYNGRFYVYFWAKAVSGGASVRVGVYDTSATAHFVRYEQFSLSTGWRLYKMVASGLNSGHTYRLYFYPGGYKVESSVLSVAYPVVSDTDTYFPYPTTAGAAADTTLGLYLTRGTKLQNLQLTNVAVTATSGGTTTLDLSLGNIRTVTMPAGNTTLTATNIPIGPVWISITQDSTGSRTVTWNSLFKFAGGTAPTPTTTANATDQFHFVCNGTNCVLQSAIYDVK